MTLQHPKALALSVGLLAASVLLAQQPDHGVSVDTLLQNARQAGDRAYSAQIILPRPASESRKPAFYVAWATRNPPVAVVNDIIYFDTPDDYQFLKIESPTYTDLDGDGIPEVFYQYDIAQDGAIHQELAVYKMLSHGPPLIRRFTGRNGGFARRLTGKQVEAGSVLPDGGICTEVWDYADGAYAKISGEDCDVSTTAGATAPQVAACNWEISPLGVGFGVPNSQSGTVAVTAPNGCPWTAVSNVPWITVTSGSSGSGSGNVGYTLAFNPGPGQRTGTVTIGGRTFTATQFGPVLSPSAASFPSSGGTGATTVTPLIPLQGWIPSSNDSWITINSPDIGAGVGIVSYSVAANNGSSERVGTFTVLGFVFTVTQAGGACTYTLSPPGISAAGAGAGYSVDVSAGGGCGWTAASNDAWIAVNAGSAGNGAGQVSITVAANPAASQRIGSLTIAGQTVTVTQAGIACTYQVSPQSAAPGNNGGAGSVGVTAANSCAWTALSNAAFLTITSGSSGNGNGTVNYSVAANPNGSQRAGTMTIAGQTFTVTQAAAACNYQVTPTSTTPGSGAGSASATVTVATGCAWTAVSNAAWITVTSGGSGNGNGTVNYSLAANPDAAQRVGTLTIAGQTFTVTQAAAGCIYSLSPPNAAVGSAFGAGSATLTTLPGCSWNLSSDAYWLNLTGAASGAGSATLNYSYFSNTQTVARAAHLNLSGTLSTVTQPGSALPLNNRSVTLLYQSFLRREPDAGGLAFWSTQPLQNLGVAFYTSVEFQLVQTQLMQLYRAFYGREPDYNTEYLPGVQLLRTGAATAASLAAQLVTQTAAASTSQLVNTMCANVNPGLPQAAAACVAASSGLLTLAPAAAAVQFIVSPAYQGIDSTQRDAVFLMYTITLNRPPDAGGFTYWLGVMTANNYDIYWLVTAFVISPEFQSRLN